MSLCFLETIMDSLNINKMRKTLWLEQTETIKTTGLSSRIPTIACT